MHTDKSPPTTAKLFWNGKSQAVRLPKAFRFEGTEVAIRKKGDTIILSPKAGRKYKNKSGAKSAWGKLLDYVERHPVPDEFMKKRPMNRPPTPGGAFDR